MKAYIRGWSSFLPNSPINNDQIEDVLGYVDGKKSRAKRIVLRSNGIQQRYYALDPVTRKPTHTNSELCEKAIYKLAKDFSLDLAQVELLSAGTSMPDQLMPAHANMVQGRVPELRCEVATMGGVCTASSMALKYAFSSIKSGMVKNAIVIGSETASHHLRAENYNQYEKRTEEELEANPAFSFEQDFLRWMLSDGAAALWVSDTKPENELSLEIEWIATRSYANELPPCMYAGMDATATDPLQATWSQIPREQAFKRNLMNLAQDVKLLDKYVTEVTVKRALSEIRKEKGLLPGDVDHFIPHYSSNYFKERLYNALNEIDFQIPYEKWFTTLTDRGNIGSASFFVYLCDFLKEKEVKDGERILAFIPESGRFSSCYVLLKAHRGSNEEVC